MTEAKDVAGWMFDQLLERNHLYQEDTVYRIKKLFGEEFTLVNANGNLGISKEVLGEFSKLTGSEVVWSRSGRYWRPRTKRDAPGRSQE